MSQPTDGAEADEILNGIMTIINAVAAGLCTTG
jgi:hypothetical protein